MRRDCAGSGDAGSGGVRGCEEYVVGRGDLPERVCLGRGAEDGVVGRR